jgi:ADP-heptose:LPS heptosyltransferase
VDCSQTHKAPRWLLLAAWVALGAAYGRRLLRRGKSILVIKTDSLGDGLLFTGVVRLLKRKYPEHRLRLLCNASTRPFWVDNQHIDEILPIPSVQTADLRERIKRLRLGITLLARPYEVVINGVTDDDVFGHAVSRLAVAGRKVWYSLPSASGGQYSDLAECTVGSHELEKLLALCRAIGIDCARGRADIQPEFRITQAHRDAARVRLAAASSATRMRVAVCAGARFKCKAWPMERYVEVLRRAAAEHGPMEILLLGSESDRSLNDAIFQSLQSASVGPVQNLAGSLSLGESAALIAESDVCIGNDTFGLHVAIVTDTPSVVIMWGGDFGRWNPWGDPDRHGISYHEMACYGCHGRCIQPDFYCVTRITVDNVTAEVRRVLNSAASGAEGLKL